MKIVPVIRALIAGACVASLVTPLAAAQSPREHLSLDAGWKFWLDVTAPLAIAPDGIFVYSSFKNNVPSRRADIHVEVNLLDTLTNAAKATVILSEP